MEKLDKYIEELLYNYECVIVPNFGGFITNSTPAYYNSISSVFYPASKKILFNKHLVYNDGLLATSVAEKKSISVEEANELLMQFKDDCFFRLNKDGRIEIEKVGVLFFDKEKNIQFQQESTNFLKDSFGLSVAPLSKIKQKEKVLKPKTKVDFIPRVELPKKDLPLVAVSAENTKKKKRNRALVPFLILPLLVFGFFYGNNQGYLGDTKFDLSSFNPFESKSIEEYNPRTGKTYLMPVQDEESEEIDNANLPAEVKEELKSKPFEAKKDSTNFVISTPAEPLKYHLIIGCFSKKENAEKLVERWNEKGKQSSIVDKKGKLYRVAIESYPSRKEAKENLKELKKTYSNSVWILKKS